MTAPALPRVATYRNEIVWGTGTPIDTSEFDDVTEYTLPVVTIDGIGRDQARAYSPPKAPALTYTLTNESGRFSPGGPLALYLGRGPAASFEAEWGVDIDVDSDDVLVDDPGALVDGLATIGLFQGTAHDMPQQIEIGQRQVAVTAVGRLNSLVVTSPTTILYENIRTDEAVAVLLDACEWPESDRSLDTGDTTLTRWWLNGQTSAMQALNAILMAEGAGSAAFEDGAGVFHFQGRQFRDNNPRSQTVQWAFFDSTVSGDAIVDSDDVLVDSDEVLVDGAVENALSYVSPSVYTSNPDEVVVSVAATINTRVPSTAPVKVWEYGGTLTLTSSEVRDVQVAATDPFKDAITPREDTDYTITAGALSGVELLTTSGQTVTLRLTAGAGGATITGVDDAVSRGIQVRATGLPVTSTQTVTSTVNTSLSTARQGAPNNPLVLDCWSEIGAEQTLDLVNSMARRYQRERRQFSLSVVNVDAVHAYAIFNLRPSDRIQVVHEQAGLNALFWVETMHYTVNNAGFIVLTLGCEQVFDLTGGRFDSDLYDVAVFGL